METAKREWRGLIQGSAIYLNEDPGMPDGQPVTVILEPRPASGDDEGRQRLLRAAGGWAGDDEEGLARYLDESRPVAKARRSEIEG